MSPEVWSDFVRIGDRVGPSKQQHNGAATETSYACWRCPYCSGTAEAVVAEGRKLQKSIACKWHFWKATVPCPNRPTDDLRGKPTTRRQSVPLPPLPTPATETADGNEADVSEAGSPAASPSARAFPRPQPEIPEGVPIAPTEEELRIKVLEQQLDTEKKRADEAVAGTLAAEALETKALAETKLANARLKKLLDDAGVSPPVSGDDDVEFVAKRQRVKEGHGETRERKVYTEVAAASRASPPRDGETTAVLAVRLTAVLGRQATAAQTVHGMRAHCAELSTAMGIGTMVAPGVRTAAVQTMVCDRRRLTAERDGARQQLRRSNGSCARLRKERDSAELETEQALRKNNPKAVGIATKVFHRAVVKVAHPDLSPRYKNVPEALTKVTQTINGLLTR